MKRFGIAVCLILMAALLGNLAALADPAAEKVRVATVYDGDTVRLTDGTKVRLAGIDTPEKDPEQYWSVRAFKRMKELLEEQGMRAAIVPVAQDRYGRLVAELYTKSGNSLNEQMLREGMAYYYAHKDLSPELAARLLTAQREALRKKAGLWKGLLERREARQTFTGNRNSLRFFSRDCREGTRISPHNQVRFRSLEAAFAAGFAPARVCEIWPLQREMSGR